VILAMTRNEAAEAAADAPPDPARRNFITTVQARRSSLIARS
jgi:hypothetical protein